MTRAVRRVVAGALGWVGALASAAAADTPRDLPAAIDVDREASPPGRAELGFDAGGVVPGWAVTGSLGYLDQPIVLRSPTTETHPVARRETMSLGGAVALGPSVVLDARLPFAHQTGDRLLAVGAPGALDRWVPGDLRFGARIRVANLPRGAAFLRADLSLPTGDERDFAGEPSWTAAWSLIGRAQLPHGIVLAATGGIRLRGAEVMLADRLVGNELFGGAGVIVPVPPIHPLWCVADQLKLTAEVVGIRGDDVAGKIGPSPAEARVGVVGRPLPSLAVGVRAGVGLADEIGAPRWRALVEVTYQGHGQLLRPSPPSSAEADED